MERTKWVDRKFTFYKEAGCMPLVLERLSGTAVRLKEITASIPIELLSLQNNNSWSILQHIGHLTDLEELHQKRIEDFIARRSLLQAADMLNEKTQKAGHNSKNLTELITAFYESRNRLISRLSALDDDTQLFQSLHPRLKLMMRPIDMAYFTAEHDDHHLASIRILINQFNNIR